MLKEVGFVDIGPSWRGIHFGRMRAAIPLPVNSDICLADAGLRDFADTDDAWDNDFDRLVGMILDVVHSAGPLEVVAPLREADSPINRLKRWLTFRPSGPLVNRDNLDGLSALCSAARDDSYLRFASVESRQVCVSTSDGHPILWIWTGVEDGSWDRIATAIAQRWPTRILNLDLKNLGPPTHYAKGPLMVDAVGQRVFWTDGRFVLKLLGEFLLPHPGNDGMEGPYRVFLPPEDEWSRVAPPWAGEVYAELLRDLKEAKLDVIRRAGATVGSVTAGRWASARLGRPPMRAHGQARPK